MPYRLAADSVLMAHALFVAFVLAGQVLIVVGLLRRWNWVRNFWFRIVHLAGIGLVVSEAWAGIDCPLTLWEKQLREAAGDVAYTGDFVAHWVHSLLFYQAPEWVFTSSYTAFGLLVLASFVLGPPRPPRRRSRPLPQITITAKIPPAPAGKGSQAAAQLDSTPP